MIPGSNAGFFYFNLCQTTKDTRATFTQAENTKNIFMKKILIGTLLFIASTVGAQRYTPTDAGSRVHFTIKNFGFNTGGQLSGLAGTIIFNPANINNAAFNVSVAVNTINTDNGTRDKHLKSPKYFDADKYPQITMKSTKVEKINSGYTFIGTVTIHGVTKPVSFPFTATPQGKNMLFKGSLSINRLDFGVGGKSAIMGDNVNVDISVLATLR
jgi:polyisoprenoid-binding protein YceI